MFTKRFIKRFNEAQTFEEWIASLQKFSFKLIRDNNLQGWTRTDFLNFWQTYKKGIK